MPTPLELAAEKLLRAAEEMEQAERSRRDAAPQPIPAWDTAPPAPGQAGGPPLPPPAPAPFTPPPPATAEYMFPGRRQRQAFPEFVGPPAPEPFGPPRPPALYAHNLPREYAHPPPLPLGPVPLTAPPMPPAAPLPDRSPTPGLAPAWDTRPPAPGQPGGPPVPIAAEHYVPPPPRTAEDMFPTRAAPAVSPFATALEGAGKGLLALRGAAGMAAAGLSQVASFSRLASPQRVATMEGSFEMVQARVGGMFLPAIDELSRGLQRLAAWLDEPRQKGAIQKAGEVGGRVAEGAVNTYGLSLANPIFTLLGAGLFAGDGPFAPKGPKKPLKESWEGLPQARISSAEEYYDRLQMSASNLDPQQTDKLATQMANLEKTMGKLVDVFKDRDSASGASWAPFR